MDSYLVLWHINLYLEINNNWDLTMYHELHIHYFPYVLGSSFITIFTWKIKFRESKYFLLSPVGSKAWRWNSDLGLYDCRAEVCAHLVLFIGCKQRCQELNLFMFYSQVQVLRDCSSALLLLSVLWETGTLCLDALDSVLILTTAPPWSWLPKCSPNPCSLLPRPLSALLEHYVFPSLVSHWQVTISATNSVANPRVVQLRANRSMCVCTREVTGGCEGKRAKQIDLRGISECIHACADIGVIWKIPIGLQALTNEYGYLL